MEPTWQNILGVKVNALNLPLAAKIIGGWIHNHTPRFVCVTPAHGVMDCYNDPSLKKVFNQSGLTTPDGMAIVWLLKLYGHKAVGRVYGPDLLMAACEAGLEKGWRHYFYGGNLGVAQCLSEKLSEEYPGINIAGCYYPPFRPLTPEEADDVVQEIRSARPDIVWVGLSTPKQEMWMSQFVDRLDGPVLIGVGAAFDFLSGTKKQAPRWVQRSGLEWLFRFLSEPRRLWPRYRQYPKFVFLALGQRLGLLNFSMEED